MATSPLDQRIQAFRSFNRFYTQRIGVLQKGLLGSPFSLAEARVLFELAHRDRPTAAELVRELGLDPGYLSRILRGFFRQGLLKKEASKDDGREQHLFLTAAGRQAFDDLDARTQDDLRGVLGGIPAADQARLVDAMHTIEEVLGARVTAPGPARDSIVLRSPEPGDMGWVVHRHGALYAREHGYDTSFEALVAEIVAKFMLAFDPQRERCWIAERDGRILGSIFLVKKAKTVAKLRLLLLEPEARGLGLGARLVDECVRFAREAGYRKITLWTQSHLEAARRLYEKAGFRLAGQNSHRSFGKDLVAETWDLEL
jgi:DNA-binding MarR family transcriptional regulator/N-acetylglutamate synthase-like GNAT family acetyltransferase